MRFYKKHPNFDSWFSGMGGGPGAQGVGPIKKLHKTKSNRRLTFGGVPFIKNIEIPKLWLPPDHPRLPAPFSPARGQKSKFRSQSFVCLLVPNLKRYDRTPYPKTPWGYRFGLFGVWAWPWGHRGPFHPPKNYLQGFKWELKISPGSVQ